MNWKKVIAIAFGIWLLPGGTLLLVLWIFYMIAKGKCYEPFGKQDEGKL